ncbi:MAG TPA: trypsin-like peptidase domain-containing protein [Candidatus Binatia bacterium]|nr:trypsin-like peptidase domain-containing protein [Candidatus Binatia bacterium]
MNGEPTPPRDDPPNPSGPDPSPSAGAEGGSDQQSAGAGWGTPSWEPGSGAQTPGSGSAGWGYPYQGADPSQGGQGYQEPQPQSGWGHQDPQQQGGWGYQDPQQQGGWGHQDAQQQGGWGYQDPQQQSGWGYQEPPRWGYPGWGYPYPQADYPPAAYPPPPPGRSSRMVPVTIAAALVVALASGVVGAGIGLALRGSNPTSSPSSSSSSPGTNSSSIPSIAPSGSGNLSAAQIAAQLDPSIVDIVNTPAGGGSIAEGTGIVISSSGEILTNNHVIEQEASLTVQIDGQGPTYSAKVIGYDPADDVSLMQMLNPPSNLKVASLGDSSTVSVGDQIVALGNAYGRGGTPAEVTGSVTALDQAITASDGDISENLSGMIQIDADIVPGDSGGPLVNSSGQVIGMDTAGSSTGVRFGGQSGGTQGFAIPIDTAIQIARQIASGKSSGSIVIGGGPLIGVGVEDATTTSGALVQSVVSGSPAAKAGIQTGDVITAFNGTQITSSADLATAIRDLRPGDTVQIGWIDASAGQHTASITLASGPPR